MESTRRDVVTERQNLQNNRALQAPGTLGQDEVRTPIDTATDSSTKAPVFLTQTRPSLVCFGAPVRVCPPRCPFGTQDACYRQRRFQ